MKQWKRIAALLLSVCTMGMTTLSTACGDKGETSSSVKDHSHVWKTEVTQEATCTETGLKKKNCTICGEEEFEVIEINPENHKIVNHEAKVPTCTGIGWDAYETCENCDYTTQEIIEVLEHNYIDGVCVNGCGEKKVCTHTWGEYEIIRAATCTEKGWKMRVCEECKEEEFDSIPAGHALVYVEGRAPTCVSDGWTAGNYCENCDYDETETIPATGHKYVNNVCVNEGCNSVEKVTIKEAKNLEGFNADYKPAHELIEKKQGKIDVVLVFENTLPGWNALAEEYSRLHGGSVVVNLNSTYTEASSYSQNLMNQVNNKDGEWDIVQGNLFLGNGLQTYCIDMYTSIIGKNAYAGAVDGEARTWKEVLTWDAYQTGKGWSSQTYTMNMEGVQTAWFVNDVARDAAFAAGYTGSEIPANWDELMELCYYMEEAGYNNPLGIALDKDSISASQFTWLLRVYGDYYYRNEYQNIMLSNEFEYDPEDTNPEANMDYGVSANKFFYSIFADSAAEYVGPFSAKYQEFIEQFQKMKPYLRASAANAEESGLKALRSEFATQSKGKSSPQILLDYAGAGLAFLKNENANFQLDFFDYPVMVSDLIPEGTALRDVDGNGTQLSIIKHSAQQDALNLDFMKFVMSPYGQSIYYTALKESGSVPMGMTTVKNDLVLIPTEWKSFFQTDKISFNGLADSNPYISYLIRGFSDGEASYSTLISNWQKYLTGTGADAMNTGAFCANWENALEEDWKDYKDTYGKDESLRTDPNGGVAL